MKNEIQNWLNIIESLDGIAPPEVKAFYFGIFESTEGLLMYLAGSFEYDEQTDDWANLESPDKAYRYIGLPDDLREEPQEIILIEVAAVLSEMEENGIFKKGILKNAEAICCGFDGGRLVKVR